MNFPAPRLLRFNTINRLLNVTVAQKLGTSTFRLPVTGGIGLNNLEPREAWLDQVISVLLAHRRGAFIDVGVNVGQTMLKVKQAAPEAPYVGFEPNPVCYAYARRLIAVNQFRHCTLIPVGLADTTRIVPMYLCDDSDVGASIVNGFRPAGHYAQTQYVPVMRGDDVLATLELRDVAVLKIDVEGGELEAIEGARDTLTRRPFVVCEILPLFSETGQKGRFRKPRQDRLLALMHGSRADFTLTFRRLSQVSSRDASSDGPVRDLFLDLPGIDAWLADYRARLAAESRDDAARREAMNRVNPKFVLRNHLAETAIRQAKEKDFSELARLAAVLQRPFDEQPENEAYAALPPDWAGTLAVSCSS